MKKIVAFVGSNRKNGYSAKVVEQIKKGAESAGAEVTVFTPGEMNIKACQGCMYCRQGNGCIIKDDDMAGVYTALNEADGAVFAMPIYFGQMSGQMMTLVNRLYPLAPPAGMKKAVTVYSHGAPAGMYQKYIDMTDPLFKALGMDVIKTLNAGLTSKMPEDQEKELFEAAFEAGKALAE